MRTEYYGDDPAAAADDSCRVCGRFPDDCICPECGVCGEQGNPSCYRPGIATKLGGHNMKMSRQQLLAQSRMRIARLEDQISDEGQYQHWLETCQDCELPDGYL